MITLDPGPSNMGLDRAALTSRNMITRSHPLPINHVYSQGVRSKPNDPVVFGDYVERCLTYVATCAELFLERSHDLLMESIATRLGTYHLFPPPTLVAASDITGERDHFLTSDSTATDWLRVFVRTEATHHQARSHQKGLK